MGGYTEPTRLMLSFRGITNVGVETCVHTIYACSLLADSDGGHKMLITVAERVSDNTTIEI
jgi:hypothetical protein